MESDESADRLVAITSKVSPGLRDRIDAARKPEESRSAAIRRLVRAGLDAEEAEPEGWRDRLGPAAFLAFLMSWSTLAGVESGYPNAAAFIIGVFAFLLIEPYIGIDRIPNPLSWL